MPVYNVEYTIKRKVTIALNSEDDPQLLNILSGATLIDAGDITIDSVEDVNG